MTLQARCAGNIAFTLYDPDLTEAYCRECPVLKQCVLGRHRPPLRRAAPKKRRDVFRCGHSKRASNRVRNGFSYGKPRYICRQCKVARNQAVKGAA